MIYAARAMPKAKKKDGRRNNGAEDRGLTEDSQLVRGPAELLQAMRDRAARDGLPVTTAWRRAAELYLQQEPKT